MPRVIFLHIPKTAGQSCYHFLDQCFDSDKVCPARENFQLVGKSISALEKFDVFRGHLDWSLLDCVSKDAFVFTILREPRERIISFYFFLRRAAAQLSDEEIELPHNRGLRAAKLYSPDDFFLFGDLELRVFHDNLLDNLYTHYFSGRHLLARTTNVETLARGDNAMKMDDIVDCALDNMRRLSGVYRISSLDLLQDDLRRIGVEPRVPTRLSDMRVNEGGGDFSLRIAELKDLGASLETFDRIDAMAAFDSQIWGREDLFRAW